jgi:signal transduction histidine kinase
VRVAVLPRDVAARVVSGGISRAVWVVNAVNLALTFPILGEFMVDKRVTESIIVPFVLLGVMLVIPLVAVFRPRAWLVVTFLAVGSVCAVAYELSLLAIYPAFITDAFFVVNRPAVSLVMVGMTGSTWLSGLKWTFAGLVMSCLVGIAVSAISGVPPITGWGPLLVFSVYALICIVLGAIQRSQRRLVPDFDELERETVRLTIEEKLRSRVTAVVHDTLLNDLALVMNGPDVLGKRTIDRLGDDIDTLTSAEWLRESEDTPIDDSDAELRNRVMLMVSDLQWRGLTVHVTGSGQGIYRIAAEVATTLVDVVRACLDNVLRHSGSLVAEIDIAYAATDVTIVVSDQGVGFDPSVIADDRLGVRMSVIERMLAVGGKARVWSSPGVGTSVVVSAPVLEVVTPQPESTHGRA